MDKYVAFLDILGFKNKLKKMSQDEATKYIGHFSTTAFNQWPKEKDTKLKGYIVSDSFIIYTEDTSGKSLHELVRTIISICKAEFSENSIVIRGAIAKGPFDQLPATEILTLRKGLIVGQAYVDAYLLEGAIKTSGIIISSSVYEDLVNVDGYTENIFEETPPKQDKQYVLRYLTLDFLLDNNNLSAFTKLAIESGWLPHYYNTIYLALKNENTEKRISQLFQSLLEIVSKGAPGENWRDIDLYIRNAFNPDVIGEFQTRFLKYIRQKLFDNPVTTNNA